MLQLLVLPKWYTSLLENFLQVFWRRLLKVAESSRVGFVPQEFPGLRKGLFTRIPFSGLETRMNYSPLARLKLSRWRLSRKKPPSPLPAPFQRDSASLLHFFFFFFNFQSPALCSAVGRVWVKWGWFRFLKKQSQSQSLSGFDREWWEGSEGLKTPDEMRNEKQHLAVSFARCARKDCECVLLRDSEYPGAPEQSPREGEKERE